MSVPELNIGIVGGSIAGCATAFALARNGHNVEVFERSAKGLRDRGSGIAIPLPLRDRLIRQSYLPADYANCPMQRRWWQFRDGTETGRRLWTQPTPAAANNWGMLWAALRSRVPDAVYHEDWRLVDFEDTDRGVTAAFANGERRDFDLLVGADGFNSVVRHKLHPESRSAFAGYILWRGNYREQELADTALLAALDEEHAWLTVPFPGGHGVVYVIPDAAGGSRTGRRRINWAIYGPVPEQLSLDGVTSIPPGAVSMPVYAALDRLLKDHFPPRIAALIRQSPRQDVSIQPIFDNVVDTYRGRRALLVGDAGTMTRPHTARGATKALEDVLALEDIAREADTVDDLLDRYDAERCTAARDLSEIGQRIGRAQVLETPDWGRMTPAHFEDWIKATLAGKTLYLFGDSSSELATA
ncbi:MAG: NAD(P)-binding protein [Hyphomicrobiales bacterium]|nr:NAD(P)-binding protein [Hyphomicrobiales bacterium]